MKNFHIKSLPESRHVHYELGTNTVFHDIKIHTDDHEPKLTFSKLLLSAFSPLLKKEFTEADETDIIFSGYTVMDIQLFLQFIMTGKCVVQNEKTLGALTDLFYDLQFQGGVFMEDFVQSRASGNSRCIPNLSETKDLSRLDKTQLEDMFKDAIAEMFFDEEQDCVTEDVKQDHEILCKEEEKMDEEAIQQEENRVDPDGVPRKHGKLEKLKGQISVEDVIKEDVSFELQIEEEETFDGETKNEQEENSFKSDAITRENHGILGNGSGSSADNEFQSCLPEKENSLSCNGVPKENKKSEKVFDEKINSSLEEIDMDITVRKGSDSFLTEKVKDICTSDNVLTSNEEIEKLVDNGTEATLVENRPEGTHGDIDLETKGSSFTEHSPSTEYETVERKKVLIYFTCPEPKCQTRKKNFFGRWNLMMHMKVHLGDVATECVTCRIQITSPLVLKKHNDRHETEPYEVKEVISKTKLIPLPSKTNKRTKKCELCGKDFPTLYDVAVHMVDHVGPKALECDLCGKLYEERAKWLKHKCTHKCGICGNRYRNVTSHKRSVHEKEREREQCSICNKYFLNLKQHMTKRHGETQENPKPGKVCCEDCGKMVSKGGIKTHRMVHHGVEKPFSCSSCEKSFVAFTRMKEHIAEVHTTERNFPCSNCEYKFSSSRRLKAHRRLRHSGTRFLCKICNTTVKHAIKYHMILHTDVKPFQCRFCGLLFKHKTGAGRHVHKFHGEKWGVKILMPKNIEDMISQSVEIVKDNEVDEKEIQKKKQGKVKKI